MRKLFTMTVCLALFTPSLFAGPRLVKSYTPGSGGTILLFVATGCPCTDAHREMVKSLTKKADSAGIKFYCVFSNEGETRDRAEHFFRQLGWETPYILDSQGKLADKFGATNTPQAFLLDAAQQVVFTGPIDDSNRNLGQIKNPYLLNALRDLTAGQPVQVSRVAPTGCWIVTKDGIKTPTQI